jgi:hypothetical protein
MSNDIVKCQTTGEIFFFCPGCEIVHKINTSWSWNGDKVRPTFNPSVKVSGYNDRKKSEFVCHSFIRDGVIDYLSDSTHRLKGQSVELKPFGDN